AVDVAGALADCDALVAPALWGETQTSLCRVALAAGRPVVASRTPGAVEALPSSCARFVTPGSAEELAAELTRLAGDGTAFADLARAAVDSSRSTKSTDDEAREWLDTYTKVVEETLPRRGVGRRSSEIEVLPGLHDVAKSFATLERMSMTELFQRAQDGVTKLKKAFGLGDSTEDLLLRVIARGGDARDRAGQLAGLRQELTESLENLELTRAAMHREEAERQGRVADLHGLLGQYEREVQSRGEETARAVKELRDHVSRTEGLEGQVEELEETARALDEKRRTAAEELDAATGRFETLAKEAERTRDALAKAEDERATFETTLSERDALVRALRDRLGAELAEADDDGAAAPGLAALERDLEGIEAFCVALEQDARTLRTHDEWMREETGRIFQALGAAAPDGGSDGGGERAAFERGIASLEALRGELDWRRTEMEAARAAGSRLRTKVLAGPLVARVKDWDRAASRFSSVPDDRRAADAREGGGVAAEGAADRAASPDTAPVAVAE
ncbi:MAG: glycosyltransferase, partial [Planctomycetota bacterium]